MTTHPGDELRKRQHDRYGDTPWPYGSAPITGDLLRLSPHLKNSLSINLLRGAAYRMNDPRYVTIIDLVCMPDGELLKVRNLGKKSLADIRLALTAVISS